MVVTNCWERNISLNLFTRNTLWRFYKWRYFGFSLSRDLMWLHGCVRLSINHQLAKFHGHRSFQRGYVTLLVYHVTTHHHIVRGSCDSVGGSSHQVSNLSCLVVIDLAEEEMLNFQFVTWLHKITWQEDHLALWVSFPHHKLSLCQVWWPSISLVQEEIFCF